MPLAKANDRPNSRGQSPTTLYEKASAQQYQLNNPKAVTT